MKTEFKYWYIRRDDNIHISECVVRFYEGEVTTAFEDSGDGPVEITRYRRSKLLGQNDLPHISPRRFIQNRNGIPHAVYTAIDFGRISTDEELRQFMMRELAKDQIREPIDEQKLPT